MCIMYGHISSVTDGVKLGSLHTPENDKKNHFIFLSET